MLTHEDAQVSVPYDLIEEVEYQWTRCGLSYRLVESSSNVVYRFADEITAKAAFALAQLVADC